MSNFSKQSKLKPLLMIAMVLLMAWPAHAFNRETPVVQAVRKVGPAVVNISSEYVVHNQVSPFGGNPYFDNFFKDFFERRPQKQVSLGSGVIIDGKRGYILTNNHVIERATTVHVTLLDERQFEVRIVGTDPDSDLAVLQITSDSHLPAVAMGNSDDLMIGETIIAIGNPFGFSHTVTTGVISAVDRSIKTDDRVFHEFIQTDASINPGNSGGPLLNINGELIGINTAIYAKAQGIGFAIPIDKAKRIISDLIQYGHVIQAWIGLMVQDLDARMAGYFDLKDARGVVVSQVEEDSPADKAGIEAGDVILTLQKRKTGSTDEYRSAARGVSAGDPVNLELLRNGKPLAIKIDTRTYPEKRVPQLTWRRLGVEINPIDNSLRRQYRVMAKQGVVITKLRNGSFLAHVGVTPGDVILQMDDNVITSEKEFTTAMMKIRLKTSVLLLVQRADQIYYLTVRMAP